MCVYACQIGKQENLPVYVFLKEPLIRAFGEKFYEVLTYIATNYFKERT
ncbi:MAG: DUF3109 family protein [Chitinophagaceae bacterium]